MPPTISLPSFFCAAFVVIFAVESKAQEAPEFQLLRSAEDWSNYEPNPDSPHPWDALKNIRGDGYRLSIGGSTRERFESFDGFGLGLTKNDSDEYLLYRLQLHADLHLGDNLRVFGEFIYADVTDRSLPAKKRKVDVDSPDFLNLFVERRFGPVTARVGRQQFLFGKQRLVSPLPWSNTWNKWDGASLAYENGKLSVDAFWGFFTPTIRRDLNEPDTSDQLFGLYGTWADSLDFYYIGRDLDSSGSERQRNTLGFRHHGKRPLGNSSLTWDHDLEMAYQFGTDGDSDVQAGMVALETGLQANGLASKPRVWLGFDWASGDRTSDDGTVNTFDQLFPLGHAYFGHADLFGRQNIIDLSTGLEMQLTSDVRFRSVLHLFWRDEENDALFSAGGGRFIAAGAAPGESYIASEIDLNLAWQINRNLDLDLGYSYVFAEDVARGAGADDDLKFSYAQFTFKF